MNKWQAWWDSLDPNTQKYLNNQPLWKDADLAKVAVGSFFLGFLLCLAMTGQL